MKDIVVQVRFRVHDEFVLRKFVEDHCSPAFKEQPAAAVLFAGLVDRSRPGYFEHIELLSHCVLPVIEARSFDAKDGLPYTLTLIVRVHHPDELWEAARGAYQVNWFDLNWEPASYGEAVYELLIASNSRPAPLDLGFEIEAVEYPTDHPYPTKPCDK
jgi:hypothetical protein